EITRSTTISCPEIKTASFVAEVLMPSFYGSGANGVVAAQFDKANTTLANVPGLVFTIVPGTYWFRAVLFVAADAVGGHKYALTGSGGLTISSTRYIIEAMDCGAKTIVLASQQ